MNTETTTATLRADTRYGVFYYYPHDCIGQALARGECHEGFLLPYFDAVPKGKTVVDVGANIGFFTVYAAKRGNAVQAFECSPEVYHLLCVNVEENGLAGLVSPHPTALYDKRCMMRSVYAWEQSFLPSGRIDFGSLSNGGCFGMQPGAGSAYDQYSETVDSFGLENVGLIKVDAQGCDLRILKGARDTIQRCQPVLLFEIEGTALHFHNETPRDYWEFVQGELKYEVEPLASGVDFMARPR